MTQNNEREALIQLLNATAVSHGQYNVKSVNKARKIAIEALQQAQISQNEQQEAVAFMDEDGEIYALPEQKLLNISIDDLIKSIGKNGVRLYTSPPKQAIPEDVIKDAERYNWLKQNYHGFEMFRHSTIPYVTLDREVDKAMLNSAPTNTEVVE